MSFYDAETRACRQDAARSMGAGPLDRACMRSNRTPRNGGQRHGGRSGLTDQPDPGLIGLTNLSAANYLATAGVGGEAGVASGFGGALVFRYDSHAGPSSDLMGTLTGSSGTFAGWYVGLVSNAVTWNASVNGTTFSGGANTYTFTPNDVGKIFCVVFFTSVAGGNFFYVSRTQIGAAVAQSAYVPATGKMIVGARQGSPATLPATNITELATINFRGVPSDAQVKALFDQVRARGDLPETFDGTTVTHRWSAKDELAGVPSVVGRKTYGARDFAAARYLQAATAGIRGAATGFTLLVLARIDMLPTGAPIRTLVSNYDDPLTVGYALYGSNSFIGLYKQSPPGAMTVYTPVAGDVGRTRVVAVTWNGTTWRGYMDAVQTMADQTFGFGRNTTTPMRVGRDYRAATVDQNDFASVFAIAGCDQALTLAELQQVQLSYEATGKLVLPNGTINPHSYDLTADVVASGNLTVVPATVADRAGSDNLTRTGAPELAIDVATAPACPAQLTDTQTRATADALLRVGSPQVRIIDPTIDGRRTLGAQGFNSANYLKSAAGAGLLGSAAGQWVAWYGVIDVLTLANGAVLAENLRITPTAQGWILQSSAANYSQLSFTAVNAAGTGVSSSVYAAIAADVGVPMLLVGVNTGTAVRFYVKRAQVGSDVAISGYAAPVAQPTTIGVRQDGTFPASNTRWFGTAGGDGVVPTLAEIQQLFDDVERTGRIQAIPGKTTRLWDPTTDTLASGVDAVPAVVLDRVGTDHLSRQGIAVQTDANSIRAVGPYGAADGWQTAPGGGIQGQNAGFHAVIDVWLTKIPTAIECPLHCGNLAGSAGWILQANSAALRFGCPGSTLTSSYTLTGADLNKRTRIAINKTPTVIQLFVNGVQVGADVASTFVALANAVMGVGQILGAQNFSSGYVECVAGGNVALSPANIATYCADLTQAPPTIPGVTLKRYVLEQDIAAVAGALPAKSVERISGGDDLVRLGSPLTLAQRTERVWSYETSPLAYGAGGFSDADYFETAGGIAGSPAGCWIGALLRVDTQAVASNTRSMLAKSNGTVPSAGWDLRSSGTNTVLTFTGTDASNVGAVGPSAVVLPADVGKLLLLVGVWDAAAQRIRVYFKRAEVSTGVPRTGWTNSPASPMRLGRHNSPTIPTLGITVFGFAIGDAIPSLAEIQALHDACTASERMAAIPGKTGQLVDLTADIVGNGGAMPASLIDRIGAAPMTRVGAPATAPTYTRAWGY